MTVDTLGPGSAPNAVTSRPVLTTIFGTINTWFQSCTGGLQNGTEITADWLNNMLAQLRTAISGTGVVANNGDDMLLRAILSAGIRYADDTGTVNALVVTNSPPLPSYKAGSAIAVKVANESTGAVTINADGLGAIAVVDADANALTGNALPAGRVILLMIDDTTPTPNARLIARSGSGIPYVADSSSTANTITANFSPAVASLAGGTTIEVKLANTVTGATTIVVNSFSAQNVTWPDGSALQANDLLAGEILLLSYDGSKFQILSTRGNPSSPTKTLWLTAAASTQNLSPTTWTKVTCLSIVNRNTLKTSTWDGTNLTIGAGEDGLWGIQLSLSLGNQDGLAFYSGVTRTRSGAMQLFLDSYMTYPGQEYTTDADTTTQGFCLMDVQVGDVINFWGSVHGASGSYPITPPGSISGITSIPNVMASRIEGLH